MYSSTTTILTEQGQRLITRLGRHWGHKFAVVQEDHRLTIPFSEDSRADMQVQAEGLSVRIDTSDPERLGSLQQVVADHLQRFAKDQTLQFHWQVI